MSARCHDEEANTLALNLMHDFVTGEKDIQQARDYYAKEFLGEGKAADPDERMLSDKQLSEAEAEGKAKEGAARFVGRQLSTYVAGMISTL